MSPFAIVANDGESGKSVRVKKKARKSGPLDPTR